MAPAVDIEATFDKAETFYAKGDRAKAKELYEQIINENNISADETESIRAKEQSIHRLNEILLITNDGEALIQLLYSARSFFYLLPKAKTTNMVRKLFESIVQGASPSSDSTRCASRM
ncbi:26S proteasome regulatory subunit RPN6 N-terminal domain containing protein, putative [Angomonas deanei]|uniref:26S proteasome regulatory subunit RPN6 N-terminal domain containing protein, putative n=1 Tax=Angomonas deanei TaxID=59799 RepID=A0A7G2BZ41_9TRYP|nr:26S proteasome regulatory subunit RPN6 N-terminal domain containing protein, putative [Angomonas deanei]